MAYSDTMTDPVEEFRSNGGTGSVTATAANVTKNNAPTQQQGSSSSGMSQWSPLSTLERQYQTQQLLLFVKTNANCCIAGGVEYILKQQKTSSSSNRTSTKVEDVTASAAAGHSLLSDWHVCAGEGGQACKAHWRPQAQRM